MPNRGLDVRHFHPSTVWLAEATAWTNVTHRGGAAGVEDQGRIVFRD